MLNFDIIFQDLYSLITYSLCPISIKFFLVSSNVKLQFKVLVCEFSSKDT